ncbi:MAG: sigma-70 family RNA polymerase sigma factor [Parcubacteria group bacterium]|nr:sigma-70 family RNA polymerase sigma factor [Parcubacteria group bacterium]
MERIAVRIPCAISDEHPRGIKEVEVQFLEKDEERDLIARWQESKDEKALNRLITAHYPLVAKIARRYSRNDNDDERFKDLFSVGTMGLVDALSKFELSKNFRFYSYARWWVLASCVEFARHDQKGGIAIPENVVRAVLRRTARTKGKLSIQGALTYEEAVAAAQKEDKGVRTLQPKEIVEVDALLSGGLFPLNHPMSKHGNDDEEGRTLAETIPDESIQHPDDGIEAQEMLAVLRRGIAKAKLTKREKFVFTERRLKSAPLTLGELGDKLGISGERVRQIEALAFRKVRNSVRNIVRMQQLKNEQE